MKVIIEGWFCFNEKAYDVSGPRLDMKVFTRSARRFDLEDLQVLSLKRFVGGCFSLTEVVGITNVNEKGSLIPFFVERETAKEIIKQQKMNK